MNQIRFSFATRINKLKQSYRTMVALTCAYLL